MSDIVLHQNPTSGPLLPPMRPFEGVGSGTTVFQTRVSDESIEGKAVERFVMRNETVRASRQFRSRKAASLGRGLRKSKRAGLLFVTITVGGQTLSSPANKYYTASIRNIKHTLSSFPNLSCLCAPLTLLLTGL